MEKILFIICYNEEQYREECKKYIQHLEFSDDYEIEITFIRDARSMAGGYNQAMQTSDAKYKVYLHQDLFIVDVNFIQNCILLFRENPEIGMLGVVGGVNLPQNGIMYSSWNCGELSTCNGEIAFEITGKIKNEEQIQYVEAVDGCMILTQYDIPWREDLFQDWDFYDISQAMEFRKRGYKIGIPKQEKAACFHDDGPRKLLQYEKNRQIFLEQYGEMAIGENLQEEVAFNVEQYGITQEIKKEIIALVDQREFVQAGAFLRNNYDNLSKDEDLTIINNIFGILLEEESMDSEIQFVGQETYKELKYKYNQYKF